MGRLNPEMPEPVVFTRPALPESQTVRTRGLEGVTVAVSRDEAFAFLYRANVDTLQALGADVVYFSPLHDQALPAADALYLTGGYPELHLSTLSGNTAMRGAIAAHQAQGKPIVAECGGMLALLDGLTDHSGQRAAMWGLVPGEASMQKRLVNLGMHSLMLPEGEVRGHTFHHARMESPLTPADHTQSQRFNGQPEAVYRIGRLHASFLHLFFPSNPSATAALFAPSH